MHKRWNLMTLLVVFSLLLTACVGPGAPAAGGGEAATGDSSTVTVTYTYPNTVFKDVGLVEEALNTLLVPAINTKIKLNPIDWGAFDEKMKLAFAAGEECDIVFTAPWINNYLLNIANGNFIPLDDLLQKHAPGLWASMPETTWDAARVDGKIYGVINQQIFVKPFGLSVRKDLADKYGLDVYGLKSYDELEPFLKAILENESDVIPLPGASTWSYEGNGFDPIITEQVPVVIRYDDKELTVFNAAASPEFQASVERARRWYEAGYTPKETIAGDDSQAMWRAGKFAVSGLVGVVKPGGEIESEQRFGQPVYSQSMTKPFLTTAGTTATTNAICATSKNPEAAMKVLELLNTNVEIYNTLAKGIEGKHWEWADKGNLVIKPGPNNADYNPNTDWEFGNQFLAYYIDPKQAEIKAWEATYDLNTTSPPSAAMGFNFNAEPVKTELANVAAVVGELAGPLTSGQVDPATALPEYLERLNQAGIQALIDECQRQLNDWAAKK
ncbi:MAG: extracellular solute-binding protein [Caldilinea sp. CFX5]|nr:extracellular solute-binding protein [Caldilinea sp. CFX5]